jgi:hypothetical protein
MLDSLEQVKKNLLIAGDETKYAGAMQQEFENRSRTTANALILMSNRIKEVGINVGSVLLPPLNSLLDIGGPIISTIAEFAQKNKTLTTVVVGVTAGLIGLKIAAIGVAYAGTYMSGGIMMASRVLGIFIPGMAAATTASGVLSLAVKGIGMAMKLAFGPVGVIVGLATLAFGLLWEKCEWFREGFTGLWEGLKSVPGLLAEAFSGAIDEMSESIKEFFSSIPVIGSAFSGLKKFFGSEGEKIEMKPVAGEAAVEAKGTDAGVVPVVGKPATQSSTVSQSPAASQSAAAVTSQTISKGTAPGVSAQFNITINGAPDVQFAQGVINALQRRKSDFEGLISSIVHDQMRVTYGG